MPKKRSIDDAIVVTLEKNAISRVGSHETAAAAAEGFELFAAAAPEQQLLNSGLAAPSADCGELF